MASGDENDCWIGVHHPLRKVFAYFCATYSSKIHLCNPCKQTSYDDGLIQTSLWEVGRETGQIKGRIVLNIFSQST